MKRAEMACKCGSSMTYTDDLGTYINGGGKPDARGRVYLIERWVDEWQERHAPCLATASPSGETEGRTKP